MQVNKHDDAQPMEFGFVPSTSKLIISVLAAELFVRGTDYISVETRSVNAAVVEDAAPLWVWGLICIGASLLVAWSMLTSKARPLILSAVVAGAVFASFALASVIVIIDRGWPIDGWRVTGLYLCMSVMWFAVATGVKLNMAVVRDRVRRSDAIG